MRRRLMDALREAGPLTGGELMERTGMERFALWKAVRTDGEFIVRRTGIRYLRLDRRIEGFARLSPSILREFLTYTVIGPPGALEATERRADELRARAEEIGRRKTLLARQVVGAAMASLEEPWIDEWPLAFILAGDIAYGMAHEEPRPERSTGQLVRGSDIDLVAVVADDVPEKAFRALEDSIFRQKYLLLSDPRVKQELDFVVKRVSTVERQLRFDGFKEMVACKILREGLFLDGHPALHDRLLGMLSSSGAVEKLDGMERSALAEREEAELILESSGSMTAALAARFYSSEESEEFE